MPRSKRNKIVSLTKTNPKGRDLKSKLIDVLRSLLEEYKHVFVLDFQNMRSARFKDVRFHWKESRIFLGKNRIAQVALGTTPEDEYKDNIRHISNRLTGNVGLLFTNRSKEEVLTYFDEYQCSEYAKAGTIPDEDIIVEPGILDFPVSILDQLRKLGLTVEVDDSRVILRTEYVAAKEGIPLTPEQAKFLVHYKKQIIKFQITVNSFWSDGQFEEL